jgi:lipoate-protein ligase A
VLVGGRKVVGSAQVREGSAFLQHGSILLAGSQDIVAVVSAAPHVARTETTLTAALGRPVSFEEVADAVIEAFGDVGAQHAAPLPSDSPTVRPSVFQDPDWTWRR